MRKREAEKMGILRGTRKKLDKKKGKKTGEPGGARTLQNKSG